MKNTSVSSPTSSSIGCGICDMSGKSRLFHGPMCIGEAESERCGFIETRGLNWSAMRLWIAASSGRACATFVNDDFLAFSRPASACCNVGGGPAIAFGALKNALSLVIGASAMVAVRERDAANLLRIQLQELHDDGAAARVRDEVRLANAEVHQQRVQVFGMRRLRVAGDRIVRHAVAAAVVADEQVLLAESLDLLGP